MSISFFWLEKGGGWGSSPLTSPADHQKLNIIQKWAFHFFGWRGVADGVWVHWPAWLIIRSWTQKEAFHFIGWRGVVDGVWVHWPAWPIIQSECNPKMSISFFCISFFWLERGGRWGSSPLTSLADHQKLNVIQKWGFHFLTEEGWRMGFESINQPGQSSEVECNPKMSISFFWLERVADGVQVHQSARQIIRSERNLKTSISFFLAGEGWWMGFESIDQPGQSSEVEHN